MNGIQSVGECARPTGPTGVFRSFSIHALIQKYIFRLYHLSIQQQRKRVCLGAAPSGVLTAIHMATVGTLRHASRCIKPTVGVISAGASALPAWQRGFASADGEKITVEVRARGCSLVCVVDVDWIMPL